jgi:hypothetical protein
MILKKTLKELPSIGQMCGALLKLMTSLSVWLKQCFEINWARKYVLDKVHGAPGSERQIVMII